MKRVDAAVIGGGILGRSRKKTAILPSSTAQTSSFRIPSPTGLSYQNPAFHAANRHE